MQKLHIEHLAVDELKPHPKNPRTHSPKQVKQVAGSIEQFGFVSPVLADAGNQIIAGHGRLLAAKKLGLETVPVVRLEHLSESQAAALRIADNKLTENSTWDEALLAESFQELSAMDLDFDLEITGFEMGEIDLLILGDESAADEEDENLPPVQERTISKTGDLWHLGKHRIFCGNSLEAESYQTLLENDVADMVFTDPPYNVPIDGHVGGLGRQKHQEFVMASGEMSSAEFTDFLASTFQNLAQFSRNGSLHYICMDWRHMPELLEAGQQVYNELKNLCVWVKDNGGMGSLYRSKHELVFIHKHGTSPHCNNVELGKHGRYRTNVWEYSGANSFARQSDEGNLLAMHPTVKPVQMVADAILDCTKRDEIVLDAFLGSGSTLIAAEKTGRRCAAIEIDPHYVDVAIRRWQQWTGDTAIHASGKSFADMEAGNE